METSASLQNHQPKSDVDTAPLEETFVGPGGFALHVTATRMFRVKEPRGCPMATAAEGLAHPSPQI